MEPERLGEFDGFINDEEEEEGEEDFPEEGREEAYEDPGQLNWSDDDSDAVPGTPPADPSEPDEDAESPLGSQGNVYRYVPDRCTMISFDEDGNEVQCGNLKNPAEQICHDCRVFGHRLTGLL